MIIYICNVHLSGMIRSIVSVTTGGARRVPGLSVMRMNVVRSWTSARGASAPAQVRHMYRAALVFTITEKAPTRVKCFGVPISCVFRGLFSIVS